MERSGGNQASPCTKAVGSTAQGECIHTSAWHGRQTESAVQTRAAARQENDTIVETWAGDLHN